MDFNGGRRRIPLIEEPRRPPWMLIVLLAGGVALLVAAWIAMDIRLELRPAEEDPPGPIAQDQERVVERDVVIPVAPENGPATDLVEVLPPAASPRWVKPPSVEFPHAGVRAPGGRGRVVLNCEIQPNRSLAGCVVVSETPPGYGFARNALAGVRNARVTSEFPAGARAQFAIRYEPPSDD